EMPIRGLLIGLFSLGTLVVGLWAWRYRHLPKLAALLILTLLAIPALQLIPLPPELWTNLPGRRTAADIIDFAAAEAWQPITLNREATLRALLNLLPPIALFT